MLLLNVMGAFAEFERSLIRERQREGINLAKQRGAYRGRTPSLDAKSATELREKAAAGVPKAAPEKWHECLKQTKCNGDDGGVPKVESTHVQALGFSFSAPH